ncbi:MAG: cysteine desulfurase [Burkholderiaceae bacterium]|jgi:cysteine desulfurase/selenocysteine lyase|nr:MAG: cysteine desulfurase [Burkholderiaceae bacterium]
MNETSVPTLDPQQIGAQFPVLSQLVHGVPLAYLDNGATTQMPRSVLAAMNAFEQHDRANIHRGVHTLSQRATDAFENARANVKRFVGAGREHELIFTSGTTDALNMVAQGMTASISGEPLLRAGDEIIVSGLEHHANLIPWQQAARRAGGVLRILRPDAEGRIDTDDLRRLLSSRTRVFAITACSNASGYRPPCEALLAMAAEAGAITVLDAAQAVGHGALDVSTLNCDFAAFSSHKMYGPMGMGGLVGRRSLLERVAPLRFGGDMVDWVSFDEAGFAELPARLEGGTPNVAGTIGMSAAADFVASLDHAQLSAHLSSLREHAVRGLQQIDGVRVLAPQADAAAIVSFVADGVHPHDIGTLLDEAGIAVRTGHHCAQPLLDHLGVGPTTRASFAVYNTHGEVERLLAGVARAIEVLR